VGIKIKARINAPTFFLLGKLLHIHRQNIEKMSVCALMLAIDFSQLAETNSLLQYLFTGLRSQMVSIADHQNDGANRI
jgi:hypothetical protein